MNACLQKMKIQKMKNKLLPKHNNLFTGFYKFSPRPE
jgi:hypothetical protein